MPKVYPPDQVDAGLMAMVITGKDSEKASAALKAEGIDIPAATLWNWVSRHPEREARYLELEAAHAPEIEKRLAQSKRALLTRIADGLRLSTEKTVEKLQTEDIKEPWKAGRDLAVISGIETRDLLLLTDRPTQITESRSVEELQRKAAELLGLTVDGTAEEIEQEQAGIGEGATSSDPSAIASDRDP